MNRTLQDASFYCSELETLSGKWFYKKLQEKNNRNKTLKGADLVKVSIRRGMANGKPLRLTEIVCDRIGL